MDIFKRIDQAQQFCKFYADGAYSVETEKWNHHVNPEFIEDIRQYIESLQLKLMHLQTQQAHRAVCKSESYDMIDRFLRNNLYDDDYDSYSEALDEIAATPVAQPKPEPVIPTAIEVQNAKENLALMKRMFGDANEPVAWMDRDGDLYRMPVIENWSPPHTLLYASPPQQQAEPVTCTWTPEDDDTGTYSSACGELWSFIDGGWKDNRVNFCHGCGGKVVEAKLKETR